jgi:hypothetical protein
VGDLQRRRRLEYAYLEALTHFSAAQMPSLEERASQRGERRQQELLAVQQHAADCQYRCRAAHRAAVGALTCNQKTAGSNAASSFILSLLLTPGFFNNDAAYSASPNH